jgi:molecular chaperone GrpE
MDDGMTVGTGTEDAQETAPGVASGAASEEADGLQDAGRAAADLEARAESDPRSRVELLAELEQLETQRDEYLDDLRRSHADFENYRKRVARDGAVQREHGRADVVTALLDVLDDLERVVTAADDLDASSLDADAAAVASGVRVVAEKAQRALETLGVMRVGEAGIAFDPTVHDAVQQVEVADVDGPVDGPTVHAVLRVGYRMTDRVLRPAMVVVAQ